MIKSGINAAGDDGPNLTDKCTLRASAPQGLSQLLPQVDFGHIVDFPNKTNCYPARSGRKLTKVGGNVIGCALRSV